MITRTLLWLVFLFAFHTSYSQAFFTSNASGAWNNPASWTLVSGTTIQNYPAAGDSVIILNGNAIQITTSNNQCQSLTIKATSSFTINANATLTISNDLLLTETSITNVDAGLLTITGNVTINQKSTLTQNGGAITVVGLIFLISPSSSAGTTTLNIDAGVFSCFGGMTITATNIPPSGRIAEFKIGNAAANVVGALTTTTSANAKITFTGIGALTLAGIITIPNAASFSAGNGRVVYAGIPGANQNVAALTYNRLTITGVGNGSKTIAGNVIVTDTLTLLTDTLIINGGGTLKLNSNATIVKTAGKILSTPTFLGQVDILYNDVQQDTTGLEMPTATGVLRNLFINNIAGVKLGNNITINNKLSLQNGELFTDNFVLNINNALGGTTTDPAIERTNGYVNGKINRSIGTSTGVRIFPFGVGLLNGYRELKIEYSTAPTVSGTMSAQHFNTAASAQTGLPLTDGSIMLTNTAPYYWQADALGGLSGGTYNATLTAEGTPGVTDLTTLRILKRPSTSGNWILNGTAGTNAGTNNAPIVVRNGMSGFSQFTIAGNTQNVLPLTLLSFDGAFMNNIIVLKWKTANEINTDYFGIEKSIDGYAFREIGKVNAVSFSSSEYNYGFNEKNIPAGKYYYRLKIVDKDGKFSYSPIVSIGIADAVNIQVYPTITNSFFIIANANNKEIFLYNLTGQFVKKLVNGYNSINELPNGVYIVKSQRETIRIIKQ
jgi:hypothetical protein